MKDTLKFLVACFVAMCSLWFICRLALWFGPRTFWFEPVVLFIRSVGLVLIGGMAFLVAAAIAIRAVTGEGRR